MKKIWSILLVLSVLLTGCAGTEPAGDGDPASVEQAEYVQAETPEPGPEAVQAAVPPELEAAQIESEARPLTREEVLEAYDRAVRAYGWFARAPLSCGEESCVVGGRRYYRVDYPGFTDLDDLRAYLRDLFAPELMERLLDADGRDLVYIEVEGALYAAPISWTRDSTRGGAETEVIQNGDGSFSVNVIVELLDEDRAAVTGVECSSFPYERVDGRWVFTDFRLVS